MNTTATRHKAGFRPGREHPKWVDEALLLENLKSKNWGSWRVVGSEFEHRKGSRYVLCECAVTLERRMVGVDNLRSGKSKGSRSARAPSDNERVLGERYDAIKQRTQNLKSRYYPDYGGRGIELRFRNRQHFIRWVLRELPFATYRGLQIDRIDNDGHYEPGNLRLVAQKENLRNTRRNRFVSYRSTQVVRQDLWHLIKTDYPDFQFGIAWTVKLLQGDVPVDEVIRRGLTPQRILPRPCRLRANPRIVARYRGG